MSESSTFSESYSDDDFQDKDDIKVCANIDRDDESERQSDNLNQNDELDFTRSDDVDREDVESVSLMNALGAVSERDASGTPTSNFDMSPPEIKLARSQKRAMEFSAEKKNDNALEEYIRCTALSKIAYNINDWRIAKYHIMLATAYLDLRGYAEQAAHHCKEADFVLKSAETSGNKLGSPEMLNVLLEMEHTRARAFTSMKKLSEAESSLIKAKQFFDALSKYRTSTMVAISSWELKLTLAYARLYMRMTNWDVSRKYFEKALELEVEEHGKNHVSLIPIYQNLGKIEQSRRPANHEKAVGHYLQAHSISTSNFGSRSLKAAETSFTTALAFADIREPDAENSAEAYLKDSLGTYRSLLGAEDERTLEVLDELARLCIRTERVMDGIKLLESSIPFKDRRYNYYSKKVASTFKLIGSGYMSLGEMDRAWKNFEKCHSIECFMLGSSHKCSQESKKTMDMLLQNPMLSVKLKKKHMNSVSRRPIKFVTR